MTRPGRCSFLIGDLLASRPKLRGLAIDTNPDFGTLGKLAPDAYRSEHQLTDVIAQMDRIRSAPELDPYMSTTPTGLHLLAAPQRPEAMEEMSPEMYGRLLSFLGRFYHVILLDLGTGLTEPWPASRSSAPTRQWSSTPPTGSPRAPCSTRSTTCCCDSGPTRSPSSSSNRIPLS